MCILGLLAVALRPTADAQTVRGVVIDPPVSLPSFTLTDHNGEAFGVEQLTGRWSKVMIGFTQCPDVCPFTLMNLEAVRAELGLRVRPDHLPHIIFLAVDPERNRPILKDYVGHFHADYIGITGEPQQIDTLVTGLDAFYRLEKKHPNDQAYDVKHSAAVAILNPKAEIVAKISPPFHPHRTADYLFKVMKGVQLEN
ncbi:SCO family protein [Candidatus Entotheonella serta]|nr:SCO family protein [Candidatus Entotheonella serta]